MILDFIKNLFNSNKETGNRKGTVKFFNVKKGFGFITSEDSGEEIFVHSTNLIDKIKENKQVTFDVEKSDKGLTAINVRLIK